MSLVLSLRNPGLDQCVQIILSVGMNHLDDLLKHRLRAPSLAFLIQ